MLDEESLSGEFVVDERGILVLPKLGEWRVSGFPADSVRPRLVAALREFLTNPPIEVTPFRRTTIVGAVAQPGLYPVYPTMSVAQAIILAGGPRPDAKEDVAEIRLPSGANSRGIGMEQADGRAHHRGLHRPAARHPRPPVAPGRAPVSFS